ncbi:MAG: alpha/beta hydrolase family protein [Janthinobacterium lividum]
MSAAISPDGDKIVYVGAYKTGGRAVTVADLKTGETKAILAGAALDVTPNHCAFKTETRVICTLYGVLDHENSFSRIIAVDTDGGNRKLLNDHHERRHSGGDILDWLPDDPHHILVVGNGAERVDVATGRREAVEASTDDLAVLGADAKGVVRFRGLVARGRTGYSNDAISYYVRAPGRREWLPVGRSQLSDDNAPSYDDFDADGTHLYRRRLLDGRQALFTLTVDGSNTETLVFAHPQVDVDGVLRIGKYRRPVAARFTVERREYHFFDPKLAVLSASLKKALPGHPEVSILDESWDGTKKLVYVDGDSRPGRYYLYDEPTRKLGELISTYPNLDDAALGHVTPIKFTARDGVMIPGYLTLPPGRVDAHGLPGLVLPHGGPSSRDETGFDWLAQFFAAEGFAVLQPNFRGSAGYGAEFFAKNGFKSWPLAIGDVNDGARWLVSQGVPAGRLAIFGWSYGGYAALQANVVEPSLYRATIAVAPVTDLDLLRDESAHSTDYQLVAAMVGTGEALLQAGSPARNAGRFKAPVMIFHADKDLNVDIEQSRAMVAALRRSDKQVDFVQYKGFDHQIDDSVAREDLLSKSAAFLRAATP